MDYKKEIEFYRMYAGNSPYEIILNSTFKDDFFMVSAGEFNYTDPIETRITLGKKTYDILTFNDGANRVISDKLFVLLKRNKITGWKTYPVSIKGVDENYHGFQVTGRCGELIEPENKNEEDSYKGLHFDPDSWDGSDIFFPKGTVLTFLSPRVKELLESNNITNIEIDNIKDCTGYY
ncbi:hypothetical protein [Aquimarina algiphila]|uniref:hypothetical protein n=1 Tax=Aquimarina algiphila TaxID=2047982 RepID=UPI00232C39D6|nr:hypothetical protein [Aquimarina algiphila]